MPDELASSRIRKAKKLHLQVRICYDGSSGYKNTAAKFNLDAELIDQLIAFDQYIWQDCQITIVDNLVSFVIYYKELGKNLDSCYDYEYEEYAPV